MGGRDAAAPADVEALERFVAANEDLQKLEDLIGRFNVFDALGVARVEIRHSNFLAWLLDPNESHGQGDLFLRAVLMDIARTARAQGRTPAVKPITLDTAELRGVEIRREWRHIDLVITAAEPALAVVIENKVDSGEHSDQLDRYEKIARETWPGVPIEFVFLTPDGDDASDADWLAYAYGDLHRVLGRVRDRAAGSLGEDVRVFLDHYLNLIGTRFMDNPDIVKLCQQIRASHRRAIDLIIEHTGGESEPLLRAFAELARDTAKNAGGGVAVFSETARDVKVLPDSWRNALPAIGDGEDRRSWLSIRFVVKDSKCWLAVRTSTVADVERRNSVLAALFDPANGLGFKPSFKDWRSQKRVLLKKQPIKSWDNDDEPNADALADEAMKQVRSLLTSLASLPKVVVEASRGVAP